VLESPALASASQPTGHITISIGVASFPQDASAQEKLVDCVDAALYASKRGGRNKVSAYEPGMEIHPGRERGPHTTRQAPLPPSGIAKA
jgi:predicted signal transduction protein with EAL and GGDEF domain